MYSATFDGTSGSRNIRLGGRRDDREGRRETLERARRERKQRQVLRQQQAAARRVQAAVRAATDLYRVRCAHRVAWDKKMHDIAALRPILLATTKQFKLPSAVLTSLLRQLLFFVRPCDQSDATRVGRFCALVLEPGMWRALYEPALGAVADSAGARAAWLNRMQRLLRICLWVVDTDVSNGGARSTITPVDDAAIASASTSSSMSASVANGTDGALSAVLRVLSIAATPSAVQQDIDEQMRSVAALLGRQLLLQAFAPRTLPISTQPTIFGVVARLLKQRQHLAKDVGELGAASNAQPLLPALLGVVFSMFGRDNQNPGTECAVTAAAVKEATSAVVRELNDAEGRAYKSFVLEIMCVPLVTRLDIIQSLLLAGNVRRKLLHCAFMNTNYDTGGIDGSGDTGALAVTDGSMSTIASAVILGNLLELCFGNSTGGGGNNDYGEANRNGTVAASQHSAVEPEMDCESAAGFVRIIAPLVEQLPKHVFGDPAIAAGVDVDAAAAELDAQLEEEEAEDEEDDMPQSMDDDQVVVLDVTIRRLMRRRERGAALARQRTASAGATLPDGVEAQLRLLLNARVISRLFGLLLQSPYSKTPEATLASATGIGAKPTLVTPVRRIRSAQADPVLELCRLYRSIVCRWGAPILTKGHLLQHGAALAVLNGLAYADTALLRALWAHITSLLHNECFGDGAGAAAATARASAETEALQPALHLFFACVVHLWHAIDDEEVFDKHRPFTSGELLRLATFLRNSLYYSYWSAEDASGTTGLVPGSPMELSSPTADIGASILSSPVLNSPGESPIARAHSSAAELTELERRLNGRLYIAVATRLFNEVFDRGSRRKICAADRWQWRSLGAVQLFERPIGTMEGVNASIVSGRAWRVLAAIPQVVPFEQRLEVLQRELQRDRAATWDPLDHVAHAPDRHFTVRRDHIFEDSFQAFTRMSQAGLLKCKLQVSFVNEQGLAEAGIDGGGLWKEFVDTLTKRGFDTEFSLFKATPDGLLYPCPASQLASEDHLEQFEFLGQVIGKALYGNGPEGSTLVEPQFADFFLNKLLGRVNAVDDLVHLDPEFYRHLMQLKCFNDDELDSLELTFEIARYGDFGGTASEIHELFPGGAMTRVNASNRIRYIHHTANYRLNTQTARQCMAFLKGFRRLIPVRWIRMFSPAELRKLICGTQTIIDVVDLRRHTVLTGGFHDSQQYIAWFWEVVDSFDAEQRGLLLKFATSCSRQPLLGFRQLQPPFTIQQVRIAHDADRLPSSGTCMNLLKLPVYSCKEVLREKLLYAIESGAGFELS